MSGTIVCDFKIPQSTSQDAVIIMSSKSDRTATHFWRFCQQANHPTVWLTYEDLFTIINEIPRLTSLIGKSAGVYQRHANIDDPESASLVAIMNSILLRHENAIVPPYESSNYSKAVHSHALRRNAERLGFQIPKSRIAHGVPTGSDWIIKGLGSMPTFAISAAQQALPRLSCPYFAQQRVIGEEYRAHVIDNEVIVHAIASKALDYRLDSTARQELVSFPRQIATNLTELARSEGLRFAGIDLIKDIYGTYWILEVNPMPGYHAYESNQKNEISTSLLQILSNPRTIVNRD